MFTPHLIWFFTLNDVFFCSILKGPVFAFPGTISIILTCVINYTNLVLLRKCQMLKNDCDWRVACFILIYWSVCETLLQSDLSSDDSVDFHKNPNRSSEGCSAVGTKAQLRGVKRQKVRSNVPHKVRHSLSLWVGWSTHLEQLPFRLQCI